MMFGERTVKFFCEKMTQESKQTTNSASDLSDTPPYANIALPEKAATSIRHIILNYLVYHCFDETALSFASGIAFGASKTESADMNVDPANIETKTAAGLDLIVEQLLKTQQKSAKGLPLIKSVATPMSNSATAPNKDASSESIGNTTHMDVDETVNQDSNVYLECLVRSMPDRKSILFHPEPLTL